MSETKFKAGLTFTIGLAFFSSQVAWSLYNAQVPVLLEEYLGSLGLIGFMMALDNILGIILQPIMGAVSDNTRTKLGRRMPYLIIGIPLGAIFFSLIPTQKNFIMLTIWILCFGTAMGFYRSQAVALMPDFIYPEHRSKGNAIINFMGGVGIAIGYFFSILLSTVGLQNLFIIISIIMVLALLVLLWRVKEKDSFTYKDILLQEEELGQKVKNEGGPGMLESFKSVVRQKDTSLLFILLAIFFWFITYQGILSLITLYGTNVLGYSAGLAGFLPFIVTVPFLITIIPLSYLTNKIGRRNAVKIGLIIWIAMLIMAYIFGITGLHDLAIIAIPLAILGIGWALINTNSIVIVWELAPTEKEIGTYTGIYYFASYLASILGPMIIGFMTDALGTPSMLLNGAYFFIIALIMMFFVKRGEVEFTDEQRAARQRAIQELRTD